MPMAIADAADDPSAGSGAHAEMMALLEDFKACSMKDLMQQVEGVVDKRFTKLLSKVADCIDEVDARTMRIQSSFEALAAANKN